MNARLEKLKIVLGTFAIEGTERNFSGDKVREIHANRGIEFKVIIDHIAQSAKTLDMPLEFQRGDGKIFSISEFQDFVIHRGNWGASVFLGSLKVQAGFVPSLNQGFVLIEEEESGAARSWDVWVEPFLSEPSFVEAWVSDAEYDYWQNASDPLEFEAAGKSVDQLPLVSNGLPAPLDQMIVDTSSNPGRWIMRDGYIEAVGSTMWLGEKFFECVGKEGNGTGLDDDVLSISSPKHGILKIENKSGPFINVESSTIQNYLRSALYN